MLSEQCRRFRAAFQAGREIDHLEHCSDCREWADATPRLRGFGADLALPTLLRERLMDLYEPGGALAPLPQLAMPPGLRRRLVAIPEQQRRLPVWITRARYGIAASLVLAFLTVSALGDTVSRGRQTAATINRQVSESQEKAAEYVQQLERQLQSTGQQSRAALDRFETDTRDRSRRLSSEVRSKAHTSLSALAELWHGAVEQVRELFPENLRASTTPAEQRRSGEKETDHGTRRSDPTE